jgi:uncharacterized protein with PIN domain
MKRIRAAYEVKFRKLLQGLHARKVGKALDWFTSRAEELSARDNILLPVGLNRVYEATAHKIAHARRHMRVPPGSDNAPVFWCDAGLGGLARWLRATGYEAHWRYGIDDAELLREAERINAIVLTTDSGLMERGVLRDEHLRAMWLPPALKIPEQLAAVFREFNLERRSSRCMSCGGEMHRTDKEDWREQIPPKTYRWLNEFYVCERCGKLFWHGTHWRKIRETMVQSQDRMHDKFSHE